MNLDKIKIPDNPSEWWKKKMRGRVDKEKVKRGTLPKKHAELPIQIIGGKRYMRNGKGTLTRLDG